MLAGLVTGGYMAAIEPAMLSITHYLVLSVALLLIGLVGALTRRNLLVRLLSIQLILAAVAINLAAFARLFADTAGQSFAFFEIAIGAAESVVLLAIIAAAFSEWQNRKSPATQSQLDAIQP